MPIRIFITTAFLICLYRPSYAQLDSIHWLPPMHARSDEGPQYLYLTTPELQPFSVQIQDGGGNLLTTATISNATPFRYSIGSSSGSITLVPEGSLQQPQTGKGLIIQGAKPFFATYRVHASSQNHAGDLTCKGRAALGKVFRIGHLEQAEFGQDRRSNFIGILATEDNTVINLSGYHPQLRFHVGINADQIIAGGVSTTLQKGESVVFSNYIYEDISQQPPNGLMGTLVEASHPVVVNCGSWLGAPVVFQGHDIGIDQIVPVELTGKEYILCKGNGSAVLEHPIIIAHTDNTEVRLNGNTAPITVLSAGDYYIVPTSAYSPLGNMYIQTSYPAYVYQMIGGIPTGTDQYRTAGLMFVPPLSCGIPNAVDNIFQPNTIGNMRFEGGLMLVAMRDSQVVVRVDGAVVNMGLQATVQGNPDFVTYRKLDLFTQNTAVNTVSVQAQGAIQVAMYGRNEPASFAAFFSGFTKTDRATVQLNNTGDGICPDTLVATGRFDGIQWAIGDSVLQYGKDSFFIAYTPGEYIATGYLGVCRRTDFAADSIATSFKSPAFMYTVAPPSCYGYTDGTLLFETPSGGIAPYQYSVDQGLTYQQEPRFDDLAAGSYHLVARDSTGCYNHPLVTSMGQPDSFGVHIVPVRIPEPLSPGGEVVLEGQPDRVISSALWEPSGKVPCPDCLDYRFCPQETTWVTLTVYDTAGCPATDRILIEVTPALFAPNVFYPGSEDPGNGTFLLFSKTALPVQRLAIFDRWGTLVFDNKNIFTNDPAAGWDGMTRGKAVEAGVYVFYAEAELLPGRITVVKGDVTVVR